MNIPDPAPIWVNPNGRADRKVAIYYPVIQPEILHDCGPSAVCGGKAN